MTTDFRVNFLVIGVQKAGTTALHDYLREHPDVTLPDVKEVHYFDDESQDWNRPDHSAYHRRFAGPDRPARGEVTPIYVYWPNSLERIRRYNPDMRLVLILRDPVERAWSHWRMERGRGVETHDFSWCIREGRARLQAADPPGFHREFSYVERGFYGRQVERLFGLFPREQVLILTSGDLDADPAGVMARLSRFLGVGNPPPLAPRRAHVGAAIEGARLLPADVEHLRGLYREDDRKLRELTGVSFA
ncbi:sulfotransferase family protein [Phenylobacterium sp.]|uniref:sulfotransferase family protein n=1 Tax=Phenylobacterium sp. TaxID=1871053 RepID=UPI0039199C6F